MKKRLLLPALLVPLFLAAGESPNNAPAPGGGLTAAEAKEDFDLMRQALEEGHSGLYRYATKADLDRSFAAHRAKLNRPMSKRQFLALLSQSIVPIHCGHTGVRPDDALSAAGKATPMFPLRVLLEGDRIKVLFNDTPDDRTILPGMEVVEINGRKAGDILDRLLLVEAGDGDIETGRRLHVANGFAQYYWATFPSTREFTIKARDTAGKIVSARLTGVTDAERKQNQNPVNDAMRTEVEKLKGAKENLSLHFAKDPDVAVVRIRYFVGDDFPQWVENTFKTLREKGTKTLVLDLRGNGGGQDMYGAMLVSYLTDKPFRYFDHIHLKTITPHFKAASDWNGDEQHMAKLREGLTPDPAGGFLVTEKGHAGVAGQQPGKVPFLGTAFVLINGGTFSTAADFCAVVHHLKRATFVGEETGGGYYGNNSGMQAIVTLPNSKFQLRVPMSEYWNAVQGGDGARRGTRPDYPVDTTSAGLLAGVDEQLDCALRLAEGGTAPK